MFHVFGCAAVIPSLAFCVDKKSAGICIVAVLRLEAFRIALFKVRRQRRSPRLYIYYSHSPHLFVSNKIRGRLCYVSTGIYRCSFLDFEYEILREFQDAKN